MGNRYLQAAQRKLLDRLSSIQELRSYGFYLAGGAAVGIYLRHRVSIDLDLFAQVQFDLDELLEILRKNFNMTSHQVEKNALHCWLDDIKCSFFYYPYPILQAPEAMPFPTASKLDIACMKLSAIIGRGAKKDFFDLHALMRDGIDFETLWQAYRKKFGVTREDLYHVAKCLAYFQDAEAETLGIANEKRSWEKVKAYFGELAKRVVQNNLGGQ